MPCKNSFLATKTYLDASPQEFSIDQYGWQCKLAFEGDENAGKYSFYVNDTLASDLPKAPLTNKADIPLICQSDNLVFLGDVVKRVTFQVFIEGLLHQFIADHNARSLCT